MSPLPRNPRCRMRLTLTWDEGLVHDKETAEALSAAHLATADVAHRELEEALQKVNPDARILVTDMDAGPLCTNEDGMYQQELIRGFAVNHRMKPLPKTEEPKT